MKALSVRQPWAELIARGKKKIEYRSWRIAHRGPLLIVASAKPDEDDAGVDLTKVAYGGAVCIVDLHDIEGDAGSYEWQLKNPRRVNYFHITGKLNIYEVPDNLIKLANGKALPPPLAVKREPRIKAAPAKRQAPHEHAPFTAKSASTETLHKHQTLALDAMRTWFNGSASRPAGYVEMPTGSGKTFTAVSALARIVEVGHPVLWIAHNAYLLKQAHKTFVSRFGEGIAARTTLLTGRVKRFDAQITLATVQTLAGSGLPHLVRLVGENRPAIAVFDEFHRSAADTWKDVVTWLNDSAIPVLGLSATPTRTGEAKRGWLGKAFPNRLFRIGITELVGARILARAQVFRIDVKGAKLRWSPEEIAHYKTFHEVAESLLKRMATQEKRNKIIVKTLLELAKAKKIGQTIAFCCGISHAEHLAKRFTKIGVPARAVTGSASDPTNADALEAFRSGEVRILTSVALLTEGVDLPMCNTVLLVRPTQSEILLKQMIGRAMRGPEMGGSEQCTILDFVDAFTNATDVSATSQGFLREYDQALAPILMKAPTKKDRQGPDLAALLRVRDWIAQNAPEGEERAMLVEEIHGVLEFFDRGANVNRAVLVPEDDREHFAKAVQEVASRMQASPRKAYDALAMAVETRDVYSKHLAGSRVAEEDFVNVVSEANRLGTIDFHPINDLLPKLAEAPVLDSVLVKQIQGLQRIADMIRA